MKGSEKVTYRDDTPITDEDKRKLQSAISAGKIDIVAQTVATWLREKKQGEDVREALAQWVIYTAKIIHYFGENDSETVSGPSHEDLKNLNSKINRIVLGVDHETIKLVVLEILKEEGVI